MESDQSSNLDSGSVENNKESPKTYTFLDGKLDLEVLKPLLTKGSVILLEFMKFDGVASGEFMLIILEDNWWHYTNSPYYQELEKTYDFYNDDASELRITTKIVSISSENFCHVGVGSIFPLFEKYESPVIITILSN